ncbi:MAG: endonuclease III [Candidatus Aenigmarchaeota archaeon]
MPGQKIQRVLEFLRKRYGERIEERMERNPDLFELLVTTVLSQRTRDENTSFASERLFSVVTSPDEILNLEDNELEELIKPSGTFRQKAKRIKDLSRVLIRDYMDSFPKKRSELLTLPGVGLKTADVVLSYGFGEPVIPVDVHVEVCSKRLGFVRKEAKYEEIRASLENLVPEKERFLVNLGFVNFGRETCRTRNPKCGECELNDICDFHLSSKNSV